MLSANVSETPRPRPPAKVRRSSALQTTSTPPPSYAAALTPENKPPLPTLFGSPVTASLSRMGWGLDSESPRGTDVEWMDEKSREELTELLVKADDLIKERETELGMASAACRSLYDDNVALKSKHQQLLARLPSSPSPSPSPEPLTRTASLYNISLTRPIPEYDSSPVESTYKSNARKISMSYVEISHLADQNSELLQKLERMESESLSADQSGRRQLKRLEKEIMTLREELEKTQAKSEELEEKTKTGWDSEKIVQEVLRKKEEREEKIRAMRNLGKVGDGDSEVRDFAPEGSSFGGPASYPFFPSGGGPNRVPTTPLSRPPYIAAPVTPHPESNLTSQLLEKMQELEETNIRIMEQQSEATNQLNAMQLETNHISRVYEYLANANIIEVASNSASECGDTDPRNETIRFKSFVRNIGGDFASTLPKDDSSKSFNIAAAPRARKSVVGLFENNLEESNAPPIPDHLKTLKLPVPFASPKNRSSFSTESGLASPAPSFQSLSPSRQKSQNNSNNHQLTLEKELGDEYNREWVADKAHNQTNNLSDLSPISTPTSLSPQSQHEFFDLSRSIGSGEQSSNTLPTPMSMSVGKSALRLSVNPPTPKKASSVAEHRAEVLAQSLRYHRMTETVRSRTNRWVNGRFKDSLTGKISVDTPIGNLTKDQGLPEPHTPVALRLTSAFDAAVENVTGQSSSQEVIQASEHKTQKKSRVFGAVILELWLWLQFAIIILVFLWAMARRGPKSVLGETGYRRTRTISTLSRG